ncbi:MAG: discoidin domain-containing protein [Phycisphaerales bacterium]
MLRLIQLLVGIGGLCLERISNAQDSFVESFASMGRWTVHASDGVRASASLESQGADKVGGSLRVEYEFVTGGGYFIVRTPLLRDLPPNYEVSFRLRGEGLPNALECKLIDGSVRGEQAAPEGDDVWWVNTRQMEWPTEWTRISHRQRRFSFAWGPGAGTTPLRRLGALEFAVAAGDGGKGTLWLDDVRLTPLPVPTTPGTPPSGSASSKMCELHDPTNLFDDDPRTAWQCEPNEPDPWYLVDLGGVREFGGLLIEWERGNWPERFEVLLSNDRTTWTSVATFESPIDRDRTLVPLRDAQARYVKLAFKARRLSGAVGIQTLMIKEPAFADSTNAMLTDLAKSLPRGVFPRSFIGEQLYWTVAGASGDDREILVSEDGQVELLKQRFMLEPFVEIEEAGEPRIISWADGATTRSQAEEFLPAFTVVRATPPIVLTTTATVAGTAGDSTAIIRHEIANTGDTKVTGRLLLAVRPLQVLPPWHELNITGGAGRIRSIERDATSVVVDGSHRITFHDRPDRIDLRTFVAGPAAPFARGPGVGDSVRDDRGLASAVASMKFELAPGASRTFWTTMPLHEFAPADNRQATRFNTPEAVKAAAKTSLESWRALARTRMELPGEAQELVRTWHATVAAVLINRDGAAIQPGSRTYERSWIRDGFLTSAAMLEAGFPEVSREFIDWYGARQYESGKIPCVVDRRGPDPVNEHDSTGQYIAAVMNHVRFTGDTEVLRTHFPRIRKGVEYMESLRASRLTPEFEPGSGLSRQEPGKPAVPAAAFRGIMPESISHEGYSAKPMHSYWDSFFALRGYKDAIAAAETLGLTDVAASWTKARDAFESDLAASIVAAMKAHGIDYVPGCVELGDFDSTSTTVAVWPVQCTALLPAGSLDRTFDRYWSWFEGRKRDPASAGEALTPYELRHVGSLVRLGRREHALAALEWYMQQRRPAGWRQWQEVVWRDERVPKFIGDSPHTWCGSDFMNSLRSMLLHERDRDGALVLLAGVPEAWLEGTGLRFEAMPTHGGTVSVEASAAGSTATVRITGTAPVPRGGIAVSCPTAGGIARASVNGIEAAVSDAGEVIVRELPATVVIERR